METIRILVTAAGAPPGLNALRALSESQNVELVATDCDSFASGLYRYRTRPYLVPPASHEDEYIKALLDICEKERVQVLFPCVDDEVICISKHKHLFEEKGIAILIPDYETVMKVTDKYNLMRLAEQRNIEHPRTYLFDEDFDISKTELRFPVVVKPRISHGAKGFFIAQNPKELKNLCSARDKQDRNLIMQEKIEGGDGSVYLCGMLFDKTHKVKASFCSRSLRALYQYGGPAIVGETVSGQQIKNECLKLFKGMEWLGPVNIEFKIDEVTKRAKLLEVNPRLWGYGYLAKGSGINFPYLWAMLSIGKDINEQHDYSLDKVLIRSTEDLIVPKNQVLWESRQ